MTETRMTLLNGRSVPQALYISVQKQVLKRAAELSLGTPYTLEMISGEHYWNGLHDGAKRQAGTIMAHLVDMGLVPFCFISPRDKNRFGTA